MNMQTTNLKDQLHDIYDMWHTPWWQTTWFYGGISIVVMLIIILLIWFLVQKIRNRSAVCTPQEQSLAQLNALATMPAHECKLFYIQLTNILKEYFSHCCQVNVRGKTDNEVIIFLGNKNTPSLIQKLFAEIVDGSMYVKFANEQAVKEKMEQDVSKAIEIVNNITIPEV